MQTYRIQHRTTYEYRYPVTISHHAAHLKPLTSHEQTCQSFRLSMTPDSSDLVERRDYFGNTTHLFSIQRAHQTLEVESRSHVEVAAQAANLAEIATPCGEIRQAMADPSRTDLLDAKQFLYTTELTPTLPELQAFGQRFLSDEQPVGSALAAMLQAFREEFEFDPEATEISTPVLEVLEKRRGVCQDFAQLMIAALKSCGIAACYASGYILTNPPPGQERLIGADASHAWLSVHIPGHGWIDLDPTNNLVCSDQHIRVAYGRDYDDVSMLSGAVTGGGEQDIKVEVTVHPVEI